MLQPLLLVIENEGCLSWNLIDDTGVYNDPDNLEGYGAPNLASSAVTSATFLVLPFGYTTGFLFTFTIVTNVITAATVTMSDGTVVDILASLTSTVFPFTKEDPFVIIGEWLGYGVDSTIKSSAYYFEYNVSDGTTVYTDSQDQLIVCETCCCVTNMEADLDARDCECKDASIEKAARAQIWLDSAIWAMEDGDVDKSQANLTLAQDLCGNKCTNC